jgi:uncharacterized membrane protein
MRYLLSLPFVRSLSGEDTKKELNTAITLLIIGVVGVLAVVITVALATYILGTFNSSGIQIPQSVNYFNTISPIVGTVVTIVFVALLVYAIVIIIRYLFKATTTFGGAAGQ